MKRLGGAVVTLLLVYATVVALQFLVGFESLYALLLTPLIILRSVYWRVGLNRLLFIILLAGVPILLRRRTRIYIRRRLQRFGEWLDQRWSAIVQAWTHLPVWLRTFLGALVVIVVLAVALLSGVLLWLITFVPFVAKTTVGLFIIRYLAQFAAAHGVREIAPMLWQVIPARFRRWTERRYRHLWWWTMRRIVRNRHRVVRRFRRTTAALD